MKMNSKKIFVGAALTLLVVAPFNCVEAERPAAAIAGQR